MTLKESGIGEKQSQLREKLLNGPDNDMNLFATMKEAKAIGIDSELIKQYALRVMAGDLRRGLLHEDVQSMVHRIAKNSGVASPEEINTLIAKVAAEQTSQDTQTELKQQPEEEYDPVQTAIDEFGYESPEHQLVAWLASEKNQMKN